MKFSKEQIKGYGNMTEEEKGKLAFLDEFEFPDPDYSGYVKKDLYDRVASELSEQKKKNAAALSEEDRKKQEREEYIAKLVQERDELVRKETISNNKARFIALGYDEDLALETATAYFDGDSEKVFANQKRFMEDHDKKIRADFVKGMPKPPAGNTSDNVTKESIMKIRDNGERQAAIAENIELFTKG